MKKYLSLSFCFMAFLLVTLSCRKTETYNLGDVPVVPYDPGAKINTTVAGTIIDENGQGISDVSITIGTTIVTTDAKGSFIIPKAGIYKNAGLVLAAKDGYFGGSRTILPKENVINNITIQLVKKTQSGSFSSSTGGSVAPTNGGSITFPANAVVTKQGGAYSGTVKVFAYFLDPTKKAAYDKMPGSLRGITTDNNEQALSSYGMMAVELVGANGEALQLATGKTANLSFPIANSLSAAAPASIPLWYFNETTGLWAQQGSATKVGNNYVGDVAHFTWWNCDYGGGPITYTIKFIDQNGNPLSDQHVFMLPSDSSRGGGHGMTASDGTLTGNIPMNTPITITMYLQTPCAYSWPGQLVYTNQVGPFTASTNGGIVTVTIPTTIPTVNISGTVVDCNNKPLANGYGIINFDGLNNYVYISNGTVNTTITRCTSSAAATATIKVFDNNSLQTNTSPVVINNITTGNYTFGQVAACGIQTAIHYTANFGDPSGNSLQGYCYFYPDSAQGTSWFNGATTFIIPANTVVTRMVTVYNACGGSTYDSLKIGPFTADFNAGNVTINVPSVNTLHITGTAVNCSGSPITKGAAIAYSTVDSSTRNFSITNGSFSIPVVNCSGAALTYSVIVIDSNNNQQNVTPVNVTITNSDVSVGQISACGLSSAQYFNYTYNGSAGTYTNYSVAGYNSNNYTYLYGSDNINSINFGVQGIATGTFPWSYTSGYNAGSSFTGVSGNITFTEYGSVGQYVAGTYTGTVSDSSRAGSTTYPVTGSFRIRRQ